MEIQGECDPRFIAIKKAFVQNFEENLEIGASIAVALDGKLVVDLWGGYVDAKKTQLWQRDTIVNVFSTTKVMVALCAHKLIDQGKLDPEVPIAKYWPEFGQAGKQHIPVKMILSHSSGVAGFASKIHGVDLYDWNRITSMLAAQKPSWIPGTKQGYHMYTFGFILGEIIKRLSGKSIGQFFKEEVADPLGIDFHIGFDKSIDPRVTDLVMNPRENIRLLSILFRILSPLSANVFFNPYISEIGPLVNTREWRAAEIPSSNGHGNARSIALTGSILACGGEFQGKQIISRNIVENAVKPQITGMDKITFENLTRGLGFSVHSLLDGRTFHWGGAGGSFCLMDLDKHISIGYAMNYLDNILGRNIRVERLLAAIQECVKKM